MMFQTQLNASHRALKQKRRVTTPLLIMIIILVSIGGIAYLSIRLDEWTAVVYQTDGMALEIGEWVYGEFTGLDHPDNILLAVGCVGKITGGVSGSVRFNFVHREMILSEFLQLNNTEIEDLFGCGVVECDLVGGSFDSGWCGPIHAQQYVWALRFLEVGEIAEGSTDVSFQVIIRPMNFL